MMMEASLLVVSYGLAALLSVFGLGGLLLVVVRLFHPPRASSDTLSVWPKVVTQLPIYNEPSVVNELQAAGKRVTLLRRDSREGYKAGALAAALLQTDAECVAMFDADFVPPADFLLRMVPRLIQQPKAAYVQARWGHLNASEGLLTRAQAAQIDAHFCVQQQARAAVDWLTNFNGSAGVWRVAAIQDAGGWQGDTLTEDLDLSHRAAMRGWTALYADDVVVPAELPGHWSAYRQQQHRWAMGSTQTLRKLCTPLWQSDLSLGKKLIGTLHLAQYLVQPALLLHCLLAPWLPQVQLWSGQVMMLMGSGFAWTGTRAVWAAVAGRTLAFQRTPKGQQGGAAMHWPWVEMLLCLYSAAAVWSIGATILPVMAMHLIGNACVCVLATMEVANARRAVG
jgi:hypothetical protein